MSNTRYRYHSLEDFVIANALSVDATFDDGWGASVAIKGREIEATILFCDISGFSSRTADMNPTETLVLANHFFTWITAEAIHHSKAIVDKYIGDEVMLVFSKEFGSEDPFAEAANVAARFMTNDVFNYQPHIGIASGKVIVGFVGTAIRYNCSVFGAPVALAARCAAVLPPDGQDNHYLSGFATFPASEWGERDLHEMVPGRRQVYDDGKEVTTPTGLRLDEPFDAALKNLPVTKVRQLINPGFRLNSFSTEDWMKAAASQILAGKKTVTFA